MRNRSFLEFEESNKKVWRIVFFLILVLGYSFRFYQYFMGRSLWEDEAHLALNFINRDYAGMLKPLDYIQAAPPLFLLTVKFFTSIGGSDEFALRALPFLASILSLHLFYYILFILTRSRVAALLGFFCFSVNIAVVYFSSELKTYEIDVACFLLMTWLTLSPSVKNRNFWLAAAGILSLLFSNIAFIILFCISVYILYGWRRKRKIIKGELAILIAWAIIFLAYFFIFIYHHPYAAIQRQEYSFAFPPLPLFSAAFFAFMKNSISEIAFGLLLYVSPLWGFGFLLLFFILLSIIRAFRRKNYTLLIFTCLPILIHFILSLLHVYPFWYRLILYFIPPLIILMVDGLFICVNWIWSRWHPFAAAALFIVCTWFFTIESFRQFPIYFREFKPVLRYINKNYPQSRIYITTPYTLYKYYYQTGKARNCLFEGLDWYDRSMPPEAYYKAVESANSNYILLHAQSPGVDSFSRVMNDLKKRGLVEKEFSYMTYTVSEIKPLTLNSNWIIFNYTSFPADKHFDLNNRNVIAIWSNDAVSKPVLLPKGKYQVTIISKGTALEGTYPHLHLLINEKMVGVFDTPPDYAPATFGFEQLESGLVVIKILMDNDALNKKTKEDRNAFIHEIRFVLEAD